MKALQVLFSEDKCQKRDNSLFSKLSQIKARLSKDINIEGVQAIQSENSDI